MATASHSSVRAVADHARNLSDDMLVALARNGGVVMINFYSGYVDMALVEEEFAEELAQRLAAFLDEPASAILERFESANSGAQLILAKDLTEQQALTLVEHREDFPGVAVIPQPVRDYPNAELAAQVLGYIGKPSAVDLERPGVKGTDVVGKAGVERYYDDQLRGVEGEIKYRVDATRSVLQRLGEQESEPGDNLILTIDSGVQAQLQESLEAGLAEGGEVGPVASAG